MIVCAFVHGRENVERASQSQVILSEATMRLCDMKYGDGASLFVLIDTNEQRLA